MSINLDFLTDIKGKYLAQDYYNLLIIERIISKKSEFEKDSEMFMFIQFKD